MIGDSYLHSSPNIEYMSAGDYCVIYWQEPDCILFEDHPIHTGYVLRGEIQGSHQGAAVLIRRLDVQRAATHVYTIIYTTYRFIPLRVPVGRTDKDQLTVLLSNQLGEVNHSPFNNERRVAAFLRKIIWREVGNCSGCGYYDHARAWRNHASIVNVLLTKQRCVTYLAKHPGRGFCL